MAGIADGLLLMHVPTIARVSKRPKRMIQQWLGAGTFVPRVDASAKSIILERIDWDGLAEAMASDIDRLSKAGRETLQVTTCVDGMPKATAWILIQTYYASFYFAQSIMRICGTVPSYYAPGELSKLNQILSVYGLQSPFPLKGQLLLTVESSTKSVTITQGNGGASHEATWHELDRLLNRITPLLSGSAIIGSDQVLIQLEIDKLKSAISGSNTGNSKLSSVRNNVQYRQELGGWYPYTNSIKSTDLIRRIARSLSEKETILTFETNHHVATIKFLKSCLCVAAAGSKLLVRLESIYGAGFLRKGFCKLHNQYAVNA